MTTRQTRVALRGPATPFRPVSLVVVLAAGTVGAQGPDEQQSIAIGEADLYPSIRIDYRADTNVGLRADDEIDGAATILSPRMLLVADRRQLSLTVSYAGAYSFGSEDALDWSDHRLGAELSAEFDARRRAALQLRLAREHDTLGSDLTRGQANLFDDPIEFDTLGLEASFVYGASGARGNAIAGLSLQARDYAVSSQVTEGRDLTKVSPYGAFSYRLSSDTRAVVELRFASVSFDDSRLDRDEVALLGGGDFAATGKLRGGFRIGADTASSADGDDVTAIVAGADLEWLPRTYATVGLELERDFDSTTSSRVGGSQSIRTTARLGWAHEWSARFSTEAFAGLVDVARVCPDRATLTVSAGLEVELSIHRWLSVGASAAQATRTAAECADDGADGSSADELDYDRTRYGVFVRATL